MVRDILKEQDIEKNVTIYRTRAVIDKYSYDANFDEIRENEFNLNTPRYVDMFEKELTWTYLSSKPKSLT